MSIDSPLTPMCSAVGHHFFAPLTDLLTQQLNQRSCPTLSDQQWLQGGIARVLSQCRSGRDFLQTLSRVWLGSISVGHFFQTLKSTRRLEMVRQASAGIGREVDQQADDPLAAFATLAGFDLYAGDGHCLEHACHDPAKGEKKWAVGHGFGLNLRSHRLVYLALADQFLRKKEHDMRLLKRQGSQFLRQGAGPGRKVLWVWDRAGIDFLAWHHWKTTAGIYFISRRKENMQLEPLTGNDFDPALPINQGIESDRIMATSQGVSVRLVVYVHPADQVRYEFITSEMTLPAGLIALLYKMRWEIEKVFDQTKTKLQETKAWASSPTAKIMQAQFMCLTHNLLCLYERQLKQQHQIENTAETQRRNRRRAKLSNPPPAAFLPVLSRPSQRSLKFIRWLRTHLYSSASYPLALAALQTLYDQL